MDFLLVNPIYTVLQTFKCHAIHYEISSLTDCSLKKLFCLIVKPVYTYNEMTLQNSTLLCLDLDNVKLTMNIPVSELSHWLVAYVTYANLLQ